MFTVMSTANTQPNRNECEAKKNDVRVSGAADSSYNNGDVDNNDNIART